MKGNKNNNKNNNNTSRFSHGVNKIQTRRLSILLSFYFHEVLQQLNIFIYKNVRFERVLDFLIEDA